MINKPGIYDIPVDEYHADPCPEPSLSSSGIVTLLDRTPAHFKTRHPRLTDFPGAVETSTKAQDLGTVVHSLVLGKGAAVKVVDPSMFTNKDGTTATTFGNKEAAAAKKQAEEEGFCVVDIKTMHRAELIAQNAINYLEKIFGRWPIGESEVTMLWQRRTSDGRLVWARSLSDHWSRRGATIIDVKTTAVGISDRAIQNAAEQRAAVQAAWYIDGAETLWPDLKGLVQFVLVYIETEPPYLVRHVRLSPTWLALAAQRIDTAVDTFARCLAANEWPGYPSGDDAEVVDMPSWAQSRWEHELGLEEIAV